MNGFYGDHILASMIAKERISHRERMTLSFGWNPMKLLTNTVRTFIDSVLYQMEQPILVPVSCTEFAPIC